MIEMDGAWFSIQTQAPPIPQLESEDVGGRADLQDHAFLTGAVHGSGWNQKMIVLGGGKAIDEALGVEGNFAILRDTELRGHCFAVGIVAQAEIDRCFGAGIEQVIAFVLRVGHAEGGLNIFGERMDLQRKVSAAHGVQKVEANWKFGAEAGVDRIAEKFARVRKDQIDGWYLDALVAEAQKQAVFFRDTIEAPGVIGLTVRKIANFFHPVTAPGPGIEKRNDAKWASGG